MQIEKNLNVLTYHILSTIKAFKKNLYLHKFLQILKTFASLEKIYHLKL